jgi:hypothetical protein
MLKTQTIKKETFEILKVLSFPALLCSRQTMKKTISMTTNPVGRQGLPTGYLLLLINFFMRLSCPDISNSAAERTKIYYTLLTSATKEAWKLRSLATTKAVIGNLPLSSNKSSNSRYPIKTFGYDNAVCVILREVAESIKKYNKEVVSLFIDSATSRRMTPARGKSANGASQQPYTL